MFGQNPIRPRTTDPMHLAVQDVFPTIQGEGPYSGCPSVFIRLAGCNLACHFCDTEFESKIDNMTPILDLVEHVHQQPEHHQKLVVLTGGEPLRQNIRLLVEMLLNRSGSKVQHIQLETAGTLWDAGLNLYVQRGELSIVCSPKTPKVNTQVAELCRHWKYIVRTNDARGADGLPQQGTQMTNKHLIQQIWRRPGGWLPEDTVWVSPCDEHKGGGPNHKNMMLVADLAMRHGYRVSLQTHKLLGVE